MNEKPALNYEWSLDDKISYLYSVGTRLNEVLGEHEWGDLTAKANTAHDEAFARVNVLTDKFVGERNAREDAREHAAAEAASIAERRRQEAEAARTREEAADRERNVAHRRKINREARDAIAKVLANLPPDSGIESDVSAAQAIVEALAKGQIPHCKMEY